MPTRPETLRRLAEQVVHDEGLPALVTRLVEDAREVASAEIAVVKAKASERVGAYKSAAIFFAVAGVLALCALIALLVGAIMALAPLVGPALATLIVVIVTLGIAGVLGLIGKGKLAAPKVTS